MFPPAVPRVPVGIAAQETPVDIPVGVALDEARLIPPPGPVGPLGHADARGATGDLARIDCAVTAIREDAVVALGGADVRARPELDFRHSP